MRTSLDAIRSLKRYVAIALGDDYEVRLLTEQGTFKRPAAQVMDTTANDLTGPRHTIDNLQSFSVHVFPEPGESVQESLGLAAVVENTMTDAFRIGLAGGHACRIPLFDYEDVAWDEGTDARSYPDYLRVRDCSVQRVQNPTEELLFTVTCDLRLAWRRVGEPDQGGVTAERLTVGFDAP